MSNNLLELADRCERTMGPDRALDCEIWQSVFGHEQYKSIAERGGDFCIRYYPGPPGPEYHLLPSFTGSIDAAIKLIPNGWPIESMSWWPSVPKGYEDQCCCRLTLLELDHKGFGGTRRFKSEAKIPALAMCAASLRARAALQQSGGHQS